MNQSLYPHEWMWNIRSHIVLIVLVTYAIFVAGLAMLYPISIVSGLVERSFVDHLYSECFPLLIPASSAIIMISATIYWVWFDP